jgi:hypothetical protein
MAILTLWSNEAVDTTYENTRTVKRLTFKCRHLIGHTIFLIRRRSGHHHRSTPTSPRCHYPWTVISLANSFPRVTKLLKSPQWFVRYCPRFSSLSPAPAFPLYASAADITSFTGSVYCDIAIEVSPSRWHWYLFAKRKSPRLSLSANCQHFETTLSPAILSP